MRGLRSWGEQSSGRYYYRKVRRGGRSWGIGGDDVLPQQLPRSPVGVPEGIARSPALAHVESE
jgi:hypothetical protein